VFLDIASRRPADYIQRRLPSMYHQFKELADVDITKEAMEVGPTCHYSMGGVRVDADTTATTVQGLFAAGEVAAGLHGANRLGGNSLSDLLVFGRRAGLYAAEYAKSLQGALSINGDQVDAIAREMLAPFENQGTENPYTIHSDLQDCMQDLVGIIRVESELKQALEIIQMLKKRSRNVKVEGNRQFNTGWHLALDLHSLLTFAEAATLAALERKESRGGHTRDDYPATDAKFAKVNIVVRKADGGMTLTQEPLPEMPDELKALLEESK
jgi:succinate dehydrogenase / fumarate reductase flavoprotein subunit